MDAKQRFNRAQIPLLTAALKIAADHVDRLRGEGFAGEEATAVSATALLSASITLLVTLGFSKERAVLALQQSLAAPFAQGSPEPTPGGTPN